MKKQKARTGWGAVAAWYDELLKSEDTYQKEVILPNIRRLITGCERVVDIGCGQGFFSCALASANVEVAGVDIAPELIARAHALAESQHARVRLAVAPAHHIPYPENSFTAALFILSLQNIREYREALTEAWRVLEPSGSLILVLNHPAFRIPSASSWGFDERTHTQYRRVDRYALPFEARIDMNPGSRHSDDKHFTISFHRSLQDYGKAITKAGFVIDGIEEWHSHRVSEKGPRQIAENTARKEFPLFLMIRAQKK